MGSLVFLLTMILFKVTLGQTCIASVFDASPTAFFTTSVTVQALDSFSSAVSGITISISSSSISPEGGTTLSGTSDGGGNVVFSIFYTATGSKTITLDCNTVAAGSFTVSPVTPVLAFGSNALPSKIGSLFTIAALVENYYGIVETENAVYTCVVTLLDDVTDVTSILSGTLSTTSSTGVCSYSGLWIANSGTYTYKVTATSGSVTFDHSSSPFDITNTVSSVTIATSTSTPTVYFSFDVTVTILGFEGGAFLDSATITLEMNDGSTIGGYSSQITTTGTYLFNIYLETVTGTALTATVNSVSSIQPLTVKSLKFLLSLPSFPTLSTDKFSLNLGVYNDAGSTIESTNYNVGGYPFTLTLVLMGSNSGGYLYNPATDQGSEVNSFTTTTTGGVLTNLDLQILSSGAFSLTVTSTFSPTITTASITGITISNEIKSITVSSSPTTIATFFNFVMTINLIGSDDNPYILGASIVLSMDDGSLGGSLSGTVTSTGTIDITGYFNTDATYKYLIITTTSPSFTTAETLSIEITQSVLILDIPSLPSTSADSFTVTVTLKSDSSGLIETNNGPYTIALQLSAVGTTSGEGISGPLLVNSVSGVSIFSPLNILSTGTFTITASLENTVSATSSNITVTNFLKTILLEFPGTVGAYQIFDINIRVLGDDDQLLIQPVLIIFPIGLRQTTTNYVTTTAGLGTISFYEVTIGSFFIMAFSINSVESLVSYVSVTPSLLKLTTDITPSQSTDVFQITITVTDSSSNDITQHSLIYVEISLSCASVCSGSVMSPGSWIGPLENGSLVISGVKIHSSGEFTLRVVNFHDEGGLTPFNSTSFTVTNFISSASVTIDASITTYFNFAFTISFMGEDSLPFLIPVMTTITINNGTIFGTTGMTVTTTGTFTIYADDSSATLLTYTVDAPYEFSGTKSVTINPCSLFPVYTPPTDSTTEFSLQLIFADSSSNAIGLNQAVPITLSLVKASTSTINSGLVLAGAGTLDSSSGGVTFSNLKVLSSGDFNLRAEGFGVQTWTSTDFYVINHVKTVGISSPEWTYPTNFTFPIRVTLTGEDDNSYILTNTLITLDLPENTFANVNPLTTDETGVITFMVYATVGGVYYFSASTSSDLAETTYFYNEIVIIDSNIYGDIVVVSYNIPSTSADQVTVNIEIHDSAGAVVTAADGLSLTLTIVCQSTCSGTVTSPAVIQGTTSAGVLSLSPFTILSSGPFVIQVAYSIDESLGLVQSVTFTVTNKPASFEVTLSPASLTTFFNFDMAITVKGEDSFDFLLTTDLTLSTSDSSLIGTLTKSGVVTSTTFTALYLNSEATTTIVITSASPFDFIFNYAITVAPCKLMITSSTLPATSKVGSSFTIGVYNADNVLESSNGPYTIVLELIQVSSTSGSVTSGSLSLETTSGVAIFSDIFVLSSGTFYMKAKSGPFTTASTANFVVTNYVKAIAISTRYTLYSAYESFDVTVVITGDDDLRYILGTTVSLTAPANIIRATADITSADGNAVYQLHSTISGTSSITISALTGTYSSATVASNQIDLAFMQDIILITTSVTPTDSLTEFELYAKVYDNQRNTLFTLANSISIAFTLACSGTCTETMTSPELAATLTINGIATISSLKILSSGSFSILATATDMESGSLTIGSIINYVTSISLTVSTSTPSAYFPFILTADVRGDDGQLYLPSFSLPITDLFGASFDMSVVAGAASLDRFDGLVHTNTFSTTYNSVTATVSYTTVKLGLKIDSITSSSISSTTSFDVLVGVYGNSLATLEDSVNNPSGYEITISLVAKTDTTENSGLLISGTVIRTTSSGLILFTSLLILSSGEFYFKATPTDSAIVDELTSTFTFAVTNSVLSISLTVPASVTRFFAFTTSATVLGSDGNNFLGICSLELSGTDSVVATTPQITSGGLATFSVYYEVTGSKTLSATCNSVTNSSAVFTVLVETLKIAFTGSTPTLSTDVFGVLVQVYDNAGTVLSDGVTKASYSIVLVLTADDSSNSGILTGTLTGDTTSGAITIEGLSVISKGTFTLDSSVTDFADILSASTVSFTIGKLIKSVNSVIPSNSPSSYFNFEITVNIVGEDDFAFLQSTTITLSEANGSLFGTTLATTSVGTHIFIVYFTTSGIKTITISAVGENTVNSTQSITILKNKIVMTGPTPVPTTSITVFTLEVKVTANDGITVESLYGPYTIELTPSPSSGILSVSSLTTTNGVASIKTVMTTDGTYTITVSTPNMDSLVTTSFTTTDVLSNITVADSLLSQNKKYLIVFPVTLVNNHALPYLHSTTLTITCSGVTALSNSISTSNATASFYMYFNTTGSKSCTIGGVGTTDPGVTIMKTFTMAITDVTSDDIECNIALTSATCFTCIVNANLNLLNSCDCSPNSVYNSNTNKCQCYDTYTETNNYCALCGNYFSSSELEASYAADYKSFSIIFARPVSVNTKASCVNSVTLPEFLSSLSPTCIWESFTKLTYTFENPVKDDTLKVIVDPKLVQTEGNTCNYDIKDLYISISTPYPMPTPVAKIVAPSLVSLSCSTEDVVISASSSSISNDYKYAWTATISPSNSALLTVIESVISSSFKIPNSMLSASKITLTLKVTNKIFETSSSASNSILVTTAAALGVSFNLGSSASIKESNFISIEAKVSEPCGTVGPYSYDWSYTSDLSAPVFNISDLLATSTKANSFLTKPGFMFAGHTYVFSVGVSSENIIGTAVLALKIEHRPLVLKLDRASGTVGVDRDLAITLTASDPDNPDASIVIAWDCISNSAVCKNSDGKKLVDGVKTPTVIIPASKLMEDAYYSFTVTASTSSKKASTSVDIKIDKSLKGELKLHSNDKVITSHKKLVIKPEIDPNEDPIFRWEINPVPDSDVPIKFDDPYLVVSEGYLKSGKTYSLTFSMKSPKGGTLSTYTSFSVNSEPLCNNFTAELNLENKWVLTGEGCGDIENSDLIVFQYGVEFETNKKWISLPMYSNSIKTKLSKDAKSVMVRVCNSYSSCSQSKVNVTINKTDKILNVLSDYKLDIENPDMVPSSIAYYAEFIEDQETFGFIYETMQEYFYSQLIDDMTVDVFLDCMDLILQNKTFVIEGNYSTNATNLANYVMKEYSENLLDSQVGSVLNTLGAYVEYIDRESLNSLLNTIGALWIGENSIDTYLRHLGDITLLRSRLSSANLLGLEINLNTSIIALPSDLPVTPDLIYDIHYSKYRAENDYIEFTFFTAGTYKSYTVVLEIPEEIEIIPITPIQISMEGIYDSGKHYECKVLINSTWEDGGCAVNSTTDTEAIIDIYHESVYVLRKNDDNCKMGRGPIAVMSILIFLTILLVIIFTIVDKNFEDVPSTQLVFLLHYPLTSICIKQQRPRRPIFALQLCTCGLLLLALIGVFHNLFDSTQNHEASFNDFYERQLSRGAAGWVLIQVFTIPIFLLNSLTDSWKKCHYLTIPVSIVISVMSSITVVIMTTQNCAGYTNYWIANFLIFLLIDLTTLQVIYSLIIFKFFIKIEVKAKENFGEEKISKYSAEDNANKDINLSNLEVDEESHYEIVLVS